MNDTILSPRNTSTTLPFPRRSSPLPNEAFDGLRLFTRLTRTLCTARPLLDACVRAQQKQIQRSGRWGVPRLFFFDRTTQAEWAARRPITPVFPEPYLTHLAPQMPEEVQAWRELPKLFDPVRSTLTRSVAARRIARAVTGFTATLEAWGEFVPAAAELRDILRVPDDQVVLAIHPTARCGIRLLIRGVATVDQLHLLLADALTGDPARGLMPGRRPQLPETDPVATTRFQLFHPAALRPDGTLPTGFTGSEFWLWGTEPTHTLTVEGSERVVLLAEPTFKTTWEVRQKYPQMAVDAEVVEILSRTEVEEWLADRAPGMPRTISWEVARSA
jgi:hypothetical protein